MTQEIRYPETKSWFKLRGTITNLTNPRKGFGYNEGESQKRVPYRSIRFMVKTSEENSPEVEIFGAIREKAYFYNKKEQNTIAVDWEKRNVFTQKGYEIITPEYDYVKEISETFTDGDDVVVIGEVVISEYTDRTGITKTKATNIIKSIYKATDSSEGKEENAFENELIWNELIDNDGEYIASAYVIKYGNVFLSYLFPISPKYADKTFIGNLRRLPYGTKLKVNGEIYNSAVVEEAETQGSNDGWGNSVSTRSVVVARKKAHEITGVFSETIEAGLFSQEMISEAIAAHVNKTTEKMPFLNPEPKKADAEDLPFNL